MYKVANRYSKYLTDDIYNNTWTYLFLKAHCHDDFAFNLVKTARMFGKEPVL